MVEMALILPLLVTLLVGLVEFSRVLMVKQVITNAAREGARAGAIRLDDNGALSTALNVSQNYISSSGLDSSTAVIDPSFQVVEGSSAIQVFIEYDYESLLTHFIPGIPDTLALRSSATMRRES